MTDQQLRPSAALPFFSMLQLQDTNFHKKELLYIHCTLTDTNSALIRMTDVICPCPNRRNNAQRSIREASERCQSNTDPHETRQRWGSSETGLSLWGLRLHPAVSERGKEVGPTAHSGNAVSILVYSTARRISITRSREGGVLLGSVLMTCYVFENHDDGKNNTNNNDNKNKAPQCYYTKTQPAPPQDNIL